MKLLKYFFVFVLPLLFLSLVGRIFLLLPDDKNYIKKLNSDNKIIESKNITKKEVYIYNIVIDSNNTSKGLNFTYNIAKKFRDKGVNVYLTRSLDYEIQQEEKFEILYKTKADLYLHISPILNFDKLYLLSTLDSDIILDQNINFIPNAINKNKKTIEVEKNIIDAFSFYFSLNSNNKRKEYSKYIDVPVDIPAISFTFKYEKDKLNSISDLIIKSVIMGLSSKI